MSLHRAPLSGYRYKYYIYTDGEVRYYHKKKYRLAKKVINPDGFVIVRLKRHWRMLDYFLHVLTANHLIPFARKYDLSFYVYHKDGNRQNNAVENLEYRQLTAGDRRPY